MNKTREIVEWWIGEGCITNDIELLLQKQGELAGYSYYFAEYVGQKHTQFITKEHNRKVEYNIDLTARISAGGKIGASEVASFLSTAELRIGEKKSEIAYRDNKLLLDQVNAILNAFVMRISYLKKELESTKSQT